ncbi:MAG: hypothetical protein K2W96_27525 [Gemmataceae bacterium]|nr:hypothetical protein [Gemmataceae bacterium]
MSDAANDARWTLRRLPLSARIVLAVFLVSVGVGYVSAIVQLHFQHAEPGSIMPSFKSTRLVFHGDDSVPISTFERLVMADEHGPWSGAGQMTAAFTTRSEGFKAEARRRAKRMAKRGDPNEFLSKGEDEVRAERLGERDIFVHWIKSGADEEAWDKYCLPPEHKGKPLTDKYVDPSDKDNVLVNVKQIFIDRCVRCHSRDGGDPKATKIPFDKFTDLKQYVKAERIQPMSLTKLAQTTHVHLLSFSMLYGISGLLLALTGLPGFIRLPLAPLPLVAQLIDISCWWLARLPLDTGIFFADLIPITGAVVGVSLLLHIVLTLFYLFGTTGRVVLALLFASAIGGAHLAMTNIVQPFIDAEKEGKAER